VVGVGVQQRRVLDAAGVRDHTSAAGEIAQRGHGLVEHRGLVVLQLEFWPAA
jgi:hypothetical protein